MSLKTNIYGVIAGIIWGAIYSFVFFSIDYSMMLFFIILSSIVGCFCLNYFFIKKAFDLTIKRLLFIAGSGLIGGLVGGILISLPYIGSGAFGAIYSLIFVFLISFSLSLKKNRSIPISVFFVAVALIVSSYLTVALFAFLFLQSGPLGTPLTY